jgi:hypothetical protein
LLASKRVIGPAPDCPASKRLQVSSTPQASGVTMPRPVTTTRRISAPQIGSIQLFRLIHAPRRRCNNRLAQPWARAQSRQSLSGWKHTHYWLAAGGWLKSGSDFLVRTPWHPSLLTRTAFSLRTPPRSALRTELPLRRCATEGRARPRDGAPRLLLGTLWFKYSPRSSTGNGCKRALPGGGRARPGGLRPGFRAK